MAVNCLDIEAAGKTDAGVMETPNSRFAMPYPRSYTGNPFRLTPTLQPGESGRFHSTNNLSTLAVLDSVSDRLHAATKHTLATVMTDTQAPITCVLMSILDLLRTRQLSE